MSEAGGSAAAWQVLLLVRSREWSRQSELAEAMGITGATLTHHLNALERQGLVRRRRQEGNRRVQRVELTDDGLEMFDRLRTAALRHDQRLRSRLDADELARLSSLLAKLRGAIGATPDVPTPAGPHTGAGRATGAP
jgi:MarR family transcriptional regulator for hemolysin